MKKHAAAAVTLYRPAYIDRGGSDCYIHVATRVEADGSLVAIFADGHEAPSVFPNVAAMLEAGRRDWRERMIPATEAGLVRRDRRLRALELEGGR